MFTRAAALVLMLLIATSGVPSGATAEQHGEDACVLLPLSAAQSVLPGAVATSRASGTDTCDYNGRGTAGLQFVFIAATSPARTEIARALVIKELKKASATITPVNHFGKGAFVVTGITKTVTPNIVTVTLWWVNGNHLYGLTLYTVFQSLTGAVSAVKKLGRSIEARILRPKG